MQPDYGSAALGGLMRSRTGRSFGNEMGSLEDLKATAKTPADLERIHMDADGKYYRPEYTANDMMLSKTGFNGGADDSRRPPMAGVGTIARAEQEGNMAKHGVMFGPMWTDVADLNRGRAATGYGQPDNPLAGFAGAAQQGAGAAQRFSYDQQQGAAMDERNNTLKSLLAGLKRAQGGG